MPYDKKPIIVAVGSPISPSQPFKGHDATDPKINWIPPAPSDKVIALFVDIAKKGVDTDASYSGSDKLLGCLKKRNGETVCLVAHERAMTKELAEPIQEAMSKAKMHVPQNIIDAKQGIRASRVLLLKAADIIGPSNPPTIYDVELGWENITAN